MKRLIGRRGRIAGYIEPRPAGSLSAEELYQTVQKIINSDLIAQDKKDFFVGDYLYGSAKLGYAQAQYEIATSGRLTVIASLEYCEKAAAQGHSEAIAALPMLKERAKWDLMAENYEKLSEEELNLLKENAEALSEQQKKMLSSKAFDAGYQAYKQKNYRVSVIHFAIAAKAGSLTAMKNLRILYDNESLDIYSPQESFRWTEKAAQLGDAESQKKCALKYLYGDGPLYGCPMPDPETALQWFEEAAKTEKDEETEQYISILRQFIADLKKIQTSDRAIDASIRNFGNFKATEEERDLLLKVFPNMLTEQKAVYTYLQVINMMIGSVNLKSEEDKKLTRNFKNNLMRSIIGQYRP